MIASLWINVPVKNIKDTVVFFHTLGFSQNPNYTDSMVSFRFGVHNFIVSFFRNDLFETLTDAPIADTSKGTQMMPSIQVNHPDDVNALLIKAAGAGGRIFSPARWDEGWMYSGGFADLDGHRWNIIFMDFEKLAQLQQVAS